MVDIKKLIDKLEGIEKESYIEIDELLNDYEIQKDLLLSIAYIDGEIFFYMQDNRNKLCGSHMVDIDCFKNMSQKRFEQFIDAMYYCDVNDEIVF